MLPLTQAFGAFPRSSLSVVEIDFQSKVLGIGESGMTFADISLFKDDFDFPYWAHEFSHEWWGNSVKPEHNSPGATLLSEGLAQYGALVALEAVKGAGAAAAYRKSDKRNSSIATFSKLLGAGTDKPLVGKPPIGQEEILLEHKLATSKGAILLDQFARMVGRERFHSLLRSFLAANAGKTTNWSAFEDHLNSGTNGAYTWWFDQWMHRAGAPDLWVRPRVEGRQVHVELGQRGNIYRLTVPIEVSGAWGSARFNVETSNRLVAQDFTAPGPIQKIVVDPDSLLPRKNPETLVN